ncbi:MAG: hypothetical protein KC455_02680 [Carnobacterium sp.]|nr:hypothetical protein [Carnobacterium sp.]
MNYSGDYIKVKNLEDDIKMFKEVKLRYRESLEDLEELNTLTSFNQILKSSMNNITENQYINVEEVFNSINDFLEKKYKKGLLFTNTSKKIKKDYIRNMLNKSVRNKKKSKDDISYFNLDEVIEIFSTPKFRFTINRWVFKENDLSERENFNEKVKDQYLKQTKYIQELSELFKQIILIEKKTTKQIYNTIKEEFNNPFESDVYNPNFDKEIKRKMSETSEYNSIWEQIQEELFEMYGKQSEHEYSEKENH